MTLATHYHLGLVLLARGQPEAALAQMQQDQPGGNLLPGLAIANFAVGRKAESDAALSRMIKEFADTGAFQIAEVLAYRGERDQALLWLERAYAQKNASLYHIKGDPTLRNLELDPHYAAFLRKMNLSD